MEEPKDVNEIIDSIKSRDRKPAFVTLLLYAVAVIAVAGLAVYSIKYAGKKLNDLQTKYDDLSLRLEEEIKELKDINENRINEMDRVLSEADSGIKNEIKQLWTSAYRKNRDSLKRMVKDFENYRADRQVFTESVNKKISSLEEEGNKLEAVLKDIMKDIERLDKARSDNISEIRKLELRITKNLDDARQYTDDSITPLEERLKEYTLEILDIKAELKVLKDEVVKISEANARLEKENRKLKAELDGAKGGGLLLDGGGVVRTGKGE